MEFPNSRHLQIENTFGRNFENAEKQCEGRIGGCMSYPVFKKYDQTKRQTW